MKTKRFLSILLALCLTMGMAFVAGMPASAANEITVTLYAQKDNAGFLLAPRQVTVRASLSEEYGYDDDFSGAQVSMLDAIVAAHVLVYGTDKAAVNQKFEFAFGGTTRMLDVPGYNFGYYANGATMGSATADQFALADGDVVSLYAYQNSWGADAFAWFEANGAKVQTLSVTAGDSVELTLRGLPAAGWGEDADMFWDMFGLDGEGPVDNAEIVPVTLSGVGAAFGASIAATNASGKATVTFNTPGEMILSAIALEDEDWCDIFGGLGWADNSMYVVLLSPWLKVTVNKTAAQLLAEAREAKLAAIDAVGGGLNEADYTAGSWAALQSAKETAKAAVNDATTVAGVNSVELPSVSLLVAKEEPGCEKPWGFRLPGWLFGIFALRGWLKWPFLGILFGWIWWLF